MKRSYINGVAFLLLLAILNVTIISNILQYGLKIKIERYAYESESFRDMNFGLRGIEEAKKFSVAHNVNLIDVITTFMVYSQFDLSGFKDKKFSFRDYEKYHQHYNTYYKRNYLDIKKVYEKALHDIQYFPVAKSAKGEAMANMPWVNYANSFGAPRAYGGDRKHEGTDIMADRDIRGYYPIVSMTDGIVENIGWLEQGGYRVGIRSKSGGYYYYAHLYSYAKGIEQGATVIAGQLLGFMGDSGYGKEEGTIGKFAVHLHLGIYVSTPTHEEMSVNPYWILKYFEDNLVKYNY